VSYLVTVLGVKLTSRSLSLWHTGKKKPIFTQAFAHGIEDTPRWITSIAHLRGSDLFASGTSAQKTMSCSKLMRRIMGRSNPLMVNRPLHAIIHSSPINPSQWVHQLPLNLVITSQSNNAGHQRQEPDHTSSCCFARTKIREMDDYEGSQKWSICSSSPCRVECKINHGTRGYACLYIMPEYKTIQIDADALRRERNRKTKLQNAIPTPSTDPRRCTPAPRSSHLAPHLWLLLQPLGPGMHDGKSLYSACPS
jgi:hypothetical protein